MPKLEPSDLLDRLTQLDGGVSQTADPAPSRGRGARGEGGDPGGAREGSWSSDSRTPNSASDSLRAEMGMDSVQQQAILDKVAQRLFGGQQRTHVIGRFEVARRLGVGGMGVVYLARDPDLDRMVAIKLLHPRRTTDEALARAEARMRIEAQAMARLSHPNVVHIHEVGVHHGQLFLAMEYVAGETLDQWLTRTRPGWRRIVDVFCQAGVGLAAAHEAGLVHRDFKPDNVLVGDDGVAKVTDFGVAAMGVRWEEFVATADGSASAPSLPGAGEALAEPLEEEGVDVTQTLNGIQHGSSSNSLTDPGTRIGTPLYMSPEQFLSAPTDGRSDQFSFCEALREALLGQHPFDAESLSELTMAVTTGKLQARPEGHTVPAWLLDVVERGLAKNPDDRWPSMAELIAALRDDPQAQRRQRLSAAAGLVLFGVLAGGVGFTLAEPEAEPVGPDCSVRASRSEGPLRAVWGAERRDAVAAVLTKADAAVLDEAGVPEGAYARESFGARVLAALDGHAEAWGSAAQEACEVAQDPSAPAFGWTAERERCLELSRVALDELGATILAAGEAGAFAGERVAARLDRIAAAAESLPDPDGCAEYEALVARHPAPVEPAQIDAVAAMRGEHERIRVQLAAGDELAALDGARNLLARAQELDFAPFTAEARALVGRAEIEADRGHAAVATLRAAMLEAEAAGHERVTIEAGTRWIRTRLRVESASPELFAWSELIAAKLERRGDARTWADYHCAMLQARNAAAEHERAREHGEACVEHSRVAYGGRGLQRGSEGHVDIARALTHLAHTELILGEADAGLEHANEAATMARRHRREAHQVVLWANQTKGQLLSLAGDFEGARTVLAHNVDVLERELGPEHSSLADALGKLAQVELELGDLDGARRSLERALAIHTESLGEHHVRVAADLGALARVELDAGALEDARATIRRALTIVERRTGHRLETATFTGILGRVELKAGHPALAVIHQRRALELAEATLGSESGHLHYFLADLGTALVAEGRPESVREALELHERALAMVEDGLEGASQAERETSVVLAGRLEDLGRAELAAGGRVAEQGRTRLGEARAIYLRAGELDASAGIDALLDTLSATDR